MFTHLNEQKKARMVDVGSKKSNDRYARAVGKIFLSEETVNLINQDNIPKGNVLNTAQVAGIMASKNTANLIPMCHNLNIESCNINFETGVDYIEVSCEAKIHAKTGIEMEVLTGVSVTLLTIYDMCKAVDKNMQIGEIKLVEKTGGKSER